MTDIDPTRARLRLAGFDLLDENLSTLLGCLGDALKGLDLAGRYVRVKALNIKVIPDWHRAKGRKSWLFVDEIISATEEIGLPGTLGDERLHAELFDIEFLLVEET